MQSEQYDTGSNLQLHGDRPDGNPATDRLGYAPTAQAIAASVRANLGRSESFVYGVHGAWGSGKTTMLHYVEHELSNEINDKQLLVVHFHPWWFSGQEALFAVFFDELLATIGESLEAKAAGALRRFASGVSGFSGVVKFGMGLTPGLNLLPEEARTAIVEAIESAGKETSRSLSDTRSMLVQALADAEFRTLVIIDDIDRLTGDEQLAVFRLVKSVAEFPKIDYLLAFDDQLAESVIQARPEYAADAAYLEKIVQGAFHLPLLPQYVLTDWLLESLNEIIAPDEKLVVNDDRHWHDVLSFVINPTLSTPRAVVRLVDALKSNWPGVNGEVDMADFVALHAIRLFRKPIYTAIRRHSVWLTREDPNSELTLGDGDEKAKERFEDILKECKSSRQGDTGAEEMLAVLFPRTRDHVRDNFRFFSSYDTSIERLRICRPERFPVYFGQQLGEMTLSRVELVNATSEPFVREQLDALIESCVSTTRHGGGSMGPVLIDELSGMLAELSQCARVGVLEALLTRGDDLVTRKDLERTGFFGRRSEWALARMIVSLLQALNAKRRASLLQNQIKSCNAPETLARVLVEISQQIDGDKDRTSGAKEKLVLDEGEFALLCDALHKQLLEQLSKGALENVSNPKALIAIWNDVIAGDGRLEEHLSQLEETKKGRESLARLLVGPGGLSDEGPYDLVPDWLDGKGPVNLDLLADKIRSDITQNPESDAVPTLKHYLEAYEHKLGLR